MQPYVFPYIGYFQLIYAVDLFVFYDDVNYINRGWVNRNRILASNKDQLFSIPCKDASQNKLIRDVLLLNDKKETQKIVTTIKTNYKKAPFFDEIFPLVEKIFNGDSKTISDLAIKSITEISAYLNLSTKYKISSQSYSNRELKKGDRLIDICHIEKEKNYINPSGGKEIYTKAYFKEKNIDLQFLVPDIYTYKQFKNSFIPWLSIIDILMFNSKEEITGKMLPSFHLD